MDCHSDDINDYVFWIISAIEQDADEDVIAAEIARIQTELSKDNELYQDVWRQVDSWHRSRFKLFLERHKECLAKTLTMNEWRER